MLTHLCSQEQRVMTVYADQQLYRDLLFNHRAWLAEFRDVPGLYGLHCNMPITPRAVQEGIDKGGNALGLEGAGNRVLGSEKHCSPSQPVNWIRMLMSYNLVIVYGLTFNNLEDASRILPEHDKFVQSQVELAKSRNLHHRYM